MMFKSRSHRRRCEIREILSDYLYDFLLINLTYRTKRLIDFKMDSSGASSYVYSGGVLVRRRIADCAGDGGVYVRNVYY
jgi:hypothetical protein